MRHLPDIIGPQRDPRSHLAATGRHTIFRHACAMGLEGIGAKRRDRPYRSGTIVGLDQGQEPGRACGDAGYRMVKSNR